MKRLFLVVLIFILPSLVEGFLVLRLNLEQLTVLADRVFVGRCLSVEKGKDKNGHPVQYVSFKVSENLKGENGETVTFKQVRMETLPLNAYESATTAFSGLPQYQVGEEVVIFLSGESELGLTAPVGLAQGKFDIKEDQQGKRIVVNGLQNQGLLLGLRKSPRFKVMSLSTGEKALLDGNPNKAEISYDDFLSLVKKLSQ
ncbi:MAG: hypothetical protein HY539_00045 [Deltaproteobacteria bacterium]|nr:hypothetical protein [Deltaproteobacteria bacterium]